MNARGAVCAVHLLRQWNQTLYDRSNGFYCCQLLITVKERKADRQDDSFLIEKLRSERDGILRNKETYASNPDIDLCRSQLNFHMISPKGKYYSEIQQRIADAHCRTRKDSVRFVDKLISASPEFFEGKTTKEMKQEKESLLKQPDNAKESAAAQLATLQKLNEYEKLRRTVALIPAETLDAAKQTQRINFRETVETMDKGE